MKKTTLYSLLCTTIILPGMVLAAEDVNAPNVTSELRKQQEALYDNVPLTPDTKAFYVDIATKKELRQRDEMLKMFRERERQEHERDG